MFSVSKNILSGLLLSFTFLQGLSGQTITPLIPPNQPNSSSFLVDEFANQLAVPSNPTTSTAAVGVIQQNISILKGTTEILYTVYDTSLTPPGWTSLAEVPNTQYQVGTQAIFLSPQIQSDHYGNVILCWIDPQGNLLASLLPAGQTVWTDFATIDSQVSLASLAVSQTPVNPFFTVAYVKESGSQSTILTSEYNLGQNWSAPAVVTTLAGEVGFLDLAVNQTDEATGYALTWELTNGMTSTIGAAASFFNPPINWLIFDNLTPISDISGKGNIFPQCVISPANVPLFTWLTTNSQDIYGIFSAIFSGQTLTFLEFIPLNVPNISLKYMLPRMEVNLANPLLQAMVVGVQYVENNSVPRYILVCVLYTLNAQGQLSLTTIDLPPLSTFGESPCAPANPVFSADGTEVSVCAQNYVITGNLLFSTISTATALAGEDFSPLNAISQPFTNNSLPRFGMNNNGDAFALWFQDPVKGSSLGYGKMFGYALIVPHS